MTTHHDELSRQRFDAAALKWDDNPGRVAMASAVVSAMKQSVPFSKSMTVLDYGAGTGLITLGLQPLVGALVAADTSPKMLKVLEGKLSESGIRNVTTRLLDPTKPFSAETPFSAIVSSMTLHHVRDTAAIFRQFYQALAPGGYLALADLDTEDGSFHGPDVPGVYHLGFDHALLRTQLNDAGFSAPQVRVVHTMTKEVKSGDRKTFNIFLALAEAKKP